MSRITRYTFEFVVFLNLTLPRLFQSLFSLLNVNTHSNSFIAIYFSNIYSEDPEIW